MLSNNYRHYRSTISNNYRYYWRHHKGPYHKFATIANFGPESPPLFRQQHDDKETDPDGLRVCIRELDWLAIPILIPRVPSLCVVQCLNVRRHTENQPVKYMRLELPPNDLQPLS